MDPVAATTSGRVRGTAEDGTVAFLGIPFARPPFGVRRFGLPVPEPAVGGRARRDRLRPDRAATRPPVHDHPRAGAAGRRLPQPQRVHPRSRQRPAPGARLDPRRRLHRRWQHEPLVPRPPVRPRRGGGRQHQLPARGGGLPLHPRCAGQPGGARLDHGPRVGAGQRGCLRRRPGTGHHRRPVGRRGRLRHPPHRARGLWPVPRRHLHERRDPAAPLPRRPTP